MGLEGLDEERGLGVAQTWRVHDMVKGRRLLREKREMGGLRRISPVSASSSKRLRCKSPLAAAAAFKGTQRDRTYDPVHFYFKNDPTARELLKRRAPEDMCCAWFYSARTFPFSNT